MLAAEVGAEFIVGNVFALFGSGRMLMLVAVHALIGTLFFLFLLVLFGLGPRGVLIMAFVLLRARLVVVWFLFLLSSLIFVFVLVLVVVLDLILLFLGLARPGFVAVLRVGAHRPCD